MTITEELAFRVLEAFARFGTARFLPFNHSGIARQKTFFAHRDTKRILQLGEGAGDTVGNGAGLPMNSSASHIDKDIVLGTDFGDIERAHHEPLRAVMAAKIALEVLGVNDKFSASGDEANPRGGVFTAAGGPDWESNISGWHRVYESA